MKMDSNLSNSWDVWERFQKKCRMTKENTRLIEEGGDTKRNISKESSPSDDGVLPLGTSEPTDCLMQKAEMMKEFKHTKSFTQRASIFDSRKSSIIRKH